MCCIQSNVMACTECHLLVSHLDSQEYLQQYFVVDMWFTIKAAQFYKSTYI
jgi:hypothetical protein